MKIRVPEDEVGGNFSLNSRKPVHERIATGKEKRKGCVRGANLARDGGELVVGIRRKEADGSRTPVAVATVNVRTMSGFSAAAGADAYQHAPRSHGIGITRSAIKNRSQKDHALSKTAPHIRIQFRLAGDAKKIARIIIHFNHRPHRLGHKKCSFITTPIRA